MTDRSETIEKRANKFKPLRFGTSGLRALVSEMTDMEVYINTTGFILFLEELGETKNQKCIALGGDLRSSSDRIMAAVKKAIEDKELDVDYCGYVPSPVLAYYAMADKMPSIMVTGSHIPEDRNGIKFTKAKGEVLKSDEALILESVNRARDEVYGRPIENSLFDENGMFKKKQDLPKSKNDAELLYKERYLNFFPDKPLEGLKVVFYQHSAVGRDLLPDILLELGAEVISVARSETFVPVDTEKVSRQTKDLLQQMANEHKPFTIISTDGDSDRPLLADEQGQFLPGDKLGALCALYLRPNFVAVPISTNDAVVKALQEQGILVAQTRIGSPYVIKAMIDRGEEDKAALLASWEANGGFLLGSDWSEQGRSLKALPTRDAILPLISALLLAQKEGLTLSQLIRTKLPERYTAAGVVDDRTPGCESYTANFGKKIIAMFSPEETDITQVDFVKSGQCIVRRGQKKEDAGEVLSEKLLGIQKKVSSFFSSTNEFSKIASVNFIDGIRIFFENNDIAHMRPSGNAPEFRMYAEADSPQRAASIVEKRKDILPLIIASFL